jgi:hypothetical protein
MHLHLLFKSIERLILKFSIAQLNDAIKETGFVAVAQPGLTPQLRSTHLSMIPFIGPDAEIWEYFEATLPPAFFEHVWLITYIRHRDFPEEALTVLHLRQWLDQTIVFMILGLCSLHDLFDNFPFSINYPNKENSLSRKQFIWINSHLSYHPTALQQILISSWQLHLSPGTFMTIDEQESLVTIEMRVTYPSIKKNLIDGLMKVTHSMTAKPITSTTLIFPNSTLHSRHCTTSLTA